MNTTWTDDDALRAGLRGIDPEAGSTPDDETLDAIFDRVRQERDSDGTPTRTRRRWLELVAAAFVGVAVVGGAAVVVDQYNSGGSDASSFSGTGAPVTTEEAPSTGKADSAASPTDAPTSSTLARDASAVVATEDVKAARDAFVAKILALNGIVTSETSTTSTPPDQPIPIAEDSAISPPMPAGSGIALSVEVPAHAYDQAVAAIAPLGDIVTFSQSSVELGQQVTQGEARITALKASIATLQDLMGKATSITDVIALEQAISERQSELDALAAQQRYLRSQVAQARISLSLLTPADAAELYGTPTAWQQFVAAVTAAWVWVGRVLLWTSPIWILLLVWVAARRRRRW